MTNEHPATMYRQGRGWIVSKWDEGYQAYVLSGEVTYYDARLRVGRANCPGAHGGKCRTPDNHVHYQDR
jgi:hypothetical protein